MWLWLVLVCLCLTRGLATLFSVNLTNVGLSYTVTLEIGGRDLALVVDSGNMDFTVLNINGTSIDFNTSYPGLYTPSPAIGRCLNLYEDLTTVAYYNDTLLAVDECNKASVFIKMQANSGDSRSLSNVTTTIAKKFFAQNPTLHNWKDTQGNIGLGYCGPGLCKRVYGNYDDIEIYGMKDVMSPFRMLLYAVSGNTSKTGTPQIVGLDFNVDDASTMQLGGVLQQYAASMKWTKQPVNFALYHSFMATSMSMCGINLLQSTRAYTWPVLVDTGQVCLQLPSEVYSSLKSWLLGANGTETYVNADALPSLMFQMDDGLTASSWNVNVDSAEYKSQAASDFLYLPLKSLLLNTNYFLEQQGAMNVTVAGVQRSLCILRNYEAVVTGSTSMVNPPPSIVFGSMTLRSLYFAADYEEVTVGLANKISTKDQERYFSGDQERCVAKTTCVGQQFYDYATNSCLDAECENYFFVELDPISRNCVYKQGMYNAGLTIIILCVIFEVSSFFANQYSSTQIMGVADPEAEGTMTSSRPMVTRVSPFTATVGKFFALIFDNIIKLTKYLIALRRGDDEEHEHED